MMTFCRLDCNQQWAMKFESKFAFKKIHLKMSSAKWRACCLYLNLIHGKCAVSVVISFVLHCIYIYIYIYAPLYQLFLSALHVLVKFYRILFFIIMAPSWTEWHFRIYTHMFLNVVEGICLNFMMTSLNGNIIIVTGPLWGESTGYRWILLTKASDAELWCFLWYTPEQTVE